MKTSNDWKIRLKKFQSLEVFRPKVPTIGTFLALLLMTVCGAGAVTIDHLNGTLATNANMAVMAKIGRLRWFFTHASVGGNITTGMNVLHGSDTNRYRLQIYNYDDNNSDWAYHGGVATEGSEGATNYCAAPDPSTTSNGMIYECMRGNPDWDKKLICFSNSVVTSGWRFPKVNVVMDKFCWIDPYADPATYCTMISGLEGRFPETLFIYLTIPLSGNDFDENDERNSFNRYVRSYCATNSRYLLDVADLEAWNISGVEQTYDSSGTTNQKMSFDYSLDEYSDWHLNVTGRRRMALAWYSLAASLFTIDRDGDGATDGDELIAGTQPTNPASCFQLSAAVWTNGMQVSFNCSTARVYALESRTNLLTGSWQVLSGFGSVTGLAPGVLSLTDTNIAEMKLYRVNVRTP